jgi:hypothetical protein
MISDYPEVCYMAWFTRHLNWTLLITWFVLTISYLIIAIISNTVWIAVVVFLIYESLLCTAAGWVCKRKGGNFWNGMVVLPFNIFAIMGIMILKDQTIATHTSERSEEL